MQNVMVRGLSALALLLAMVAPAVAVAASTFYGITVHVSTNNIKVKDPRTNQTLSFELVPKFDQVFSSDGKTTYQMSAIKAGTFVKIYYDQKAMGARHADKIYVYKSNSQFPTGTQ